MNRAAHVDEHHGRHEHGDHGAPAAPDHAGHKAHGSHAGHDHSHMVADFRKRFWVCLLLTLPVLALSPMIQHMLGVEDHWRFTGDTYLLAAVSTFTYFYGGWPFLDGLRQEIAARNPGMMTLIGVAITAAFIYSASSSRSANHL